MEERSARRHRLWCEYLVTRDQAVRSRLIIESAELLKWAVERLALDLPPGVPMELLTDYAAAELQNLLDEAPPAGDVKYDTHLLSRTRTAVLDGLRRSMGSDAAVHRVISPLLHNCTVGFREGGVLPPADVVLGRPCLSREEQEGLLSGVSLAVLIHTCGSLMCETTGGGGAFGENDETEVAKRWQVVTGALAGAIARLPGNERLALTLYHFEGLTITEVARVLKCTQRSAGALFALASLHVLGQVNRVLTTLSPNRMDASARIWPWADGPGAGAFPDLVVVCAEVHTAGVVHGIAEEAVAELVESPWPGKEAVVAWATPARNGRDGRAIRLFDADACSGAGTGAGDGTGAVAEPAVVKGWVSKGQALVRVEPPTQGVDGIDVTGVRLKARHGSSVTVERGPNVEDSPDGADIVASIDGQAWLVGGSFLALVPVLRAESIEEGRTLQFPGTVVVSGAIGPRSCVMAAWDVVAGRIECSEVSAGGDVVVGGGITGCTGRGILAGGDLRARFVEISTVQAVGRVFIGERTLRSRIEACRGVHAENAWVCGGAVVSAGDVHVGRAGTELGTKTALSAGERSVLYEDLLAMAETARAALEAAGLRGRMRSLTGSAVAGMAAAENCAIHVSGGVRSGVVLRVAGSERQVTNDLGPGRAVLTLKGWVRWEPKQRSTSAGR
ncbi:MAG: DUF342 domain-containing protein [Firmicutes bacterium]|nr:DUF342 domain-containing protein [Bacillota bacterium]